MKGKRRKPFLERRLLVLGVKDSDPLCQDVVRNEGGKSVFAELAKAAV